MKKEGLDKYTSWFSELGKDDTPLVGGKGANLGEMYNLGIPVPPGFCITTKAYSYFLEDTGLDAEIYSILKKLDPENTAELEEVSKKIQKMITDAEMPSEMQGEIIDNYEALNIDPEVMEKASSDALSILRKGYEPVFVAVRSSATAEDTGAASFAGQQETFLNTKGRSAVIEAVKKCWASLFTARSIYYRIKKGFKHESILISVVIQVMVNSDKSGVIFSKNPIENNENIIIEAVYGLGEGIVSGKINPDNYSLTKDIKIVSKSIANKKIAISRDSSGSTATFNLTEERSKSQVLSESEIKKLAEYAIELEEHYKKPQDIEFAIDSGRIFIVQTRPITTLDSRQEIKEITGNEVLKGQAASPGIGSGTVRIIRTTEDLSKIRKGDILVTKMTNPDMVVAMQKCSAIVTDDGGITSHAAIVSREMGIPAVIGTIKATQTFKENQEITVNGFTGKIYLGKQENIEAEIKPAVKTETKLKVIIDLPDYASRAAKTGIKSAGLVRIEGIIAESGKHPLHFYKEDKIKDYEKIIFSGLDRMGKYFDELWVRASDIRSDEYMNLQGAPKEKEVNPMLGMHGIRFSLKNKEIFKAELLALKKLAEQGKNVGLIIPQVILLEEVTETKKILQELNFNNLKIGVMIETPAAVQIIEDLCKLGINFISFGTNDLTQYTLAVDRGNELCQYLYDETNPAVLSQLSYVIRKCKKYNVETSICGQAGSNKKMVEFLVKNGIDGISLNADKASEISEFIRDLESKGLRNSAEQGFINKERGENNMAKKKQEKKSEEINDLEHVEEKIEEKVEEVKEENKEKVEKFKKETQKQGSEEYPDIDIGFDIFQQQ